MTRPGVFQLGSSVVLAGVICGAAFGSHAAASSDLRAETNEETGDSPWDGRVAGTSGQGLRVFPGPNTAFPTQTVVPEGSRVRVLEGPRLDRHDRHWYLVTAYGPPGAIGWGAGEYLVRINPGEAEPALRPAPAQERAPERTFQAQLTAYAHGTTTSSGTPVRWGVVAVDPQVIPLGSRLMIEGFDNLFVAEDTGGGIRGNHVDLYFPDLGQATQFGVQHRSITVLDEASGGR